VEKQGASYYERMIKMSQEAYIKKVMQDPKHWQAINAEKAKLTAAIKQLPN
jgi:hypothetical protein